MKAAGLLLQRGQTHAEFQSPCGEGVMKVGPMRKSVRFYRWFQSPCGEGVMKDASPEKQAMINKLIVSVPLRGSGDESRHYTQDQVDTIVSVPLRGSGDERSMPNGHGIEMHLNGFQSPCGEVVMKGHGKNGSINRPGDSFSPLAGKW